MTSTTAQTKSSDNGAHASGHSHNGDMPKIGMWVFLFTELILFGTLFIAYAVYLEQYTKDFRIGSGMLNVPIGALNTLILLTSSLTMALSIAALARSKKKHCLILLAVTVLCAVMFLGIKSMEWGTKFHHHIYPKSELFATWPKGQVVYFGLYYVMTGLHALHVIVGSAVILIAFVMVKKNRIRSDRIAFLENTGLYWHLVDMIWIFLFPLFYLIG
ncbi:cytochrome c oxidase subunit 3 family protein [Acidobacteriota bacterium]